LWYGIFLLVPLGITVIISFVNQTAGGAIKPDFTIMNYVSIFTNPTNVNLIVFTLELSLIVTLVSLVVGYILGYYLALMIKSIPVKMALFLLFLTPFWIETTTKAISWIPVLGENGFINFLLLQTGIIGKPIALFLFSRFAATMVMIISYFLMMAAPIFITLSRMDPLLLDAAKSLGANRIKAFYHITWKISLPGVIIGCVFVFVLSIIDFATPSIMGGVIQTIGMQIAYQTFALANVAAASTYATIITVFRCSCFYACCCLFTDHYDDDSLVQ
jgi:putative spermidine/putrescine transport system permease protein